MMFGGLCYEVVWSNCWQNCRWDASLCCGALNGRLDVDVNLIQLEEFYIWLFLEVASLTLIGGSPLMWEDILAHEGLVHHLRYVA